VLFSIVLALLAAEPPPTDGSRCDDWVVGATRRLIVAEQPPASPLPPVSELSFSGVRWTTWEALEASARRVRAVSSEEAGRRRVAVVRGEMPLGSAPEFERELQLVDSELAELRKAVHGPGNRLPDSLQLWSLGDDPERAPTFMALQNAARLWVLEGWRGLAAGRPDLAATRCAEALVLARAEAGTQLIGRMFAVASARDAEALCLSSANALASPQRELLSQTLKQLRQEWPLFSDILEKELIFGQLAFFAGAWPESSRAAIPSPASKLLGWRSSKAEPLGWTDRLRRLLFAAWAARDHCAALASAVQVADRPLWLVEPVLRRAGEAPLSQILLSSTESDGSSWVRFARRSAELDTRLALLHGAVVLLGAYESSGNWPSRLDPPGSFLDARTGAELRVDLSSENFPTLVASADSRHEAPEIRLPVRRSAADACRQ
jgi:hypothetical protein